MYVLRRQISQWLNTCQVVYKLSATHKGNGPLVHGPLWERVGRSLAAMASQYHQGMNPAQTSGPGAGLLLSHYGCRLLFCGAYLAVACPSLILLSPPLPLFFLDDLSR